MAGRKQYLRKWTEETVFAEATNGIQYLGPMELVNVDENEPPGQRELEPNMGENSVIFENDDDWSDVNEHFTETQWADLPLIEKQKCRTLKRRYTYMVQNGVPIAEPWFMSKSKENTEQSLERKRVQSSPVAGERSSSRLRENVRINYREIIPSQSPQQHHLHSPDSSPSQSPNHHKAASPPKSPAGLPGGSSNVSASPSTCTRAASSASLGRKAGGRIPERNLPTFDQMVIGLPKFGEKSLTELSKVRMDMNMRQIHHDCKAHIRRSKKEAYGDEYLTRKQWNDYAKDVCDAYPNLKNEGSKYWESLKVGLQKSFRAERKAKKKKALASEATVENPGSTEEDEAADEVDDEDSTKNPLDIEAEAASNELKKESCDRRNLKALLETSLRFRKVERASKTPSQMLELYPHLKIPEMMIFDYLSTIEVALEECERVFKENIVLLGAHYEIGSDLEIDKLNIMVRVHEHFLSKAVKKGVKPVFIVKYEERRSLQAMESSNIQAPFIVILTRQDFITGLHEVRRATLLMENDIVCSLTKPQIDKTMLLLLGAYVTLNSEYPSPYQQFMRALEKLVTGKAQPSKYGRTQVQYDRLMSLLKKKIRRDLFTIRKWT